MIDLKSLIKDLESSVGQSYQRWQQDLGALNLAKYLLAKEEEEEEKSASIVELKEGGK